MIRVVKTDKFDDFHRRIYKDETNRKYVDINCNDHNPQICTTCKNGEPEYPIEFQIVLSRDYNNHLFITTDVDRYIEVEKNMYIVILNDNREYIVGKYGFVGIVGTSAIRKGQFSNRLIEVSEDKQKEHLKILSELKEEDKRIQFKDSTGKPVELRDMFSHILK